MNIEKRLAELNLSLPEVPPPDANYLPYIVHRDLVFVSGQIAFQDDGVLYAGTVPDPVTMDQAQASARLCALHLLAVAKQACGGDLNRLQRCIRLDGYVQCTRDFTDQATVMNGASDLLVELLDDAGRHVRTAIGVSALPLNASVEVNGVFAIDSA